MCEEQSKLDILIPLGVGSPWQNNELRYCLRSIERFATGFDRIFIIGEDPQFLNGSTVFAGLPDIHGNREARIAFKILWAFQNTDVSDKAIVFNDDYVLNAPVDLGRLDYFHRGPLSRSIARWKPNHAYGNSLRATKSALAAAGRTTLDYDVHFPILYRRQNYLELIPWWGRSLHDKYGLLVHSVYANNVLSEPGPLMEDCKIRVFHRRAFENQISGRIMFSYGDSALSIGLKNWLAERFPEKSAWEK